MKSLDPKTIRSLHAGVFSWYRKHQRELQWRKTSDPYEILVSEIMLQQTQVSRVQQKLPHFLKLFPTIRTLARSSNAMVVRAWQGMGYNNRALRLRDLARTIMTDHHGEIPSDVDVLQTLPGIGPYTSHAVTCFAFRKRTAVVDVNITRVLSRLLWKMNYVSDRKPEKEIWRVAEQLLPRNAYVWNQALMDLGAVICVARKPLCSYCPVRGECRSNHLRSSARTIPIRNTSHRHPADKKNTEPMYNGIPRRIWRGKIIQTLRTVEGGGTITLVRLGTLIKQDFKARELPWLTTLLRRLEQERLVSIQAHASTLRVRLAE